jgi:hypothetical protein
MNQNQLPQQTMTQQQPMTMPQQNSQSYQPIVNQIQPHEGVSTSQFNDQSQQQHQISQQPQQISQQPQQIQQPQIIQQHVTSQNLPQNSNVPVMSTASQQGL